MQKTTRDSAKNIGAKIHTIKIIAGRFKGKILEARILPHTRPTKAIVRESVFNTIAPFLRGKIFVECFAGYGSMGFEALSRGAEKVIFLEKDVQSFGILQKNIALFGSVLGDLQGKIMAQNVDCFSVLGDLLENGDIFYFDPPFGENGEFYKMIFALLDLVDLRQSAQNLAGKMLIFEHISSFIMPKSIANLPLQKYKKFGKTSISYYFMA